MKLYIAVYISAQKPRVNNLGFSVYGKIKLHNSAV